MTGLLSDAALARIAQRGELNTLRLAPHDRADLLGHIEALTATLDTIQSAPKTRRQEEAAAFDRAHEAAVNVTVVCAELVEHEDHLSGLGLDAKSANLLLAGPRASLREALNAHRAVSA